MIFTVTFQITAYHENSRLNKKSLQEKDFEAKSLDKLFEILDERETIDSVDDSDVMVDDPIEVNVEYVLICDEKGKEVYRDKSYEVKGSGEER